MEPSFEIRLGAFLPYSFQSRTIIPCKVIKEVLSTTSAMRKHNSLKSGKGLINDVALIIEKYATNLRRM